MIMIRHISNRVAVMYLGVVVELTTRDELYAHPLHPYTHGLIGSVPSRNRRGSPLTQIPGMMPALANLPPGCAFRNRCPRAAPACLEEPKLSSHKNRLVRCFYPMHA